MGFPHWATPAAFTVRTPLSFLHWKTAAKSALFPVKDRAKESWPFESVRLTFQNKVTLQDPRVDLTLLQTSGAVEGAETNQGKFLGHNTNAEPYIPASSDDGYPEASLSHSL